MLTFFCDNVISVITPIMLLLTGLYFSFKLNFFHMRHPIKMIRSMLSKPKNDGISPFRAVTLALAGTLGVGNIAGVASSIAIGGFGSVFWMWISALVAMVLKYAEIVLSLRYREKNDKGEWVGGPMYYIKNGLNLKWLAGIFAVFATIACLGTGNATQSNSIAVALKSTVGINPWITGLVLLPLQLFWEECAE